MTDAPLQSPLYERFAPTDALMIPYGSGGQAVEVVGAFEEVGLEYAAIRKGCVLFDQPHTGTLVATGADRLAFLNNMVTQKVIDLQPGVSRRSFWLSRKGRVEADLRLSEFGDRTLISLDRHIAAQTASALGNYLFSEDAAIEDRSPEFHRMSLHGVTALPTLAQTTGNDAAGALEPGRCLTCEIGGHLVIAERDDLTGEPGVELCVAREAAPAVYDAILATGRVKPCGWFAINTARIEAGRAMFNVDFGPENLPAETGVIESRVDFRKGCYLGQEVVARMDARKTRKQVLVAIRVKGPGGRQEAPLPTAGDRLFAPGDEGGNPIGTVTSSTVSPMLSAASIAFAMIRDASAAAGTELVVNAEGTRASAVVQESLVFWARNA